MLVNKRSFKLIKTNSRLEKIFGRILSQVLLRPLSWLGHKARQILKSLFFPSRRGRVRLTFVFVLLLAVLAGLVDWPKIPTIKYLNFLKVFNTPKYHLGLDLAGGAQLVYEADMSQVPQADRLESLVASREVIERRINTFGVGEPVVQTSVTGSHYRVLVELPGITDLTEAVKKIGETPILEFRQPQFIKFSDLPEEQRPQPPEGQTYPENEGFLTFIPTQLTGQYLKRSQVQFDPNTSLPVVSLEFNDEGKKIFADLTKQFVGQEIAIYLDNVLVSAPRVNEQIENGQAIISGNFTLKEAKEMVRRLNAGALPVPIKIVNESTIGASLGNESLFSSLRAGLLGLSLVAVFMIVYYRLPGLLSVLALIIYALVVLAIFKLWPVVLTLAGIAGFILSVGMAVDANVLIFERVREELKDGLDWTIALERGFKRAWTSIRDSNVSSLITAGILAWFGSSAIRGFAVTLAIGILVSMFSAITVSRTFLRLLAGTKLTRIKQLF